MKLTLGYLVCVGAWIFVGCTSGDGGNTGGGGTTSAGGTAGSGGTAGGGTGGTAGAGAGGTGTGGGATAQIICGSDESIVFPALDKSCNTVDDCVLIGHQLDCCQTEALLAINKNAEADFDAVESQCQGAFPPCGCPAGPWKVEDGNTADSLAEVAINCVESVCLASVP
ncbi:MAG: hypothetical protein IPK82_02640 [Polyangiaceae bacterium]|nr:hypothetical protein [Polyangiaceae bacterium]